jgi:hypothetical protein
MDTSDGALRERLGVAYTPGMEYSTAVVSYSDPRSGF